MILNSFSSDMLLGVAFRYGKDSFEYEMAGGVRRSDRSRRISAGMTERPDTTADAS